MRALIIIAGVALALGACGNNDQTDNSQNIDENLTAEDIVSNDVTAIDAVTGDAANMAADVNYTDENLAEPASNAAKPSSRSARTKPAGTPSTPEEPVANAPAPANAVQ